MARTIVLLVWSVAPYMPGAQARVLDPHPELLGDFHERRGIPRLVDGQVLAGRVLVPEYGDCP